MHYFKAFYFCEVVYFVYLHFVPHIKTLSTASFHKDIFFLLFQDCGCQFQSSIQCWAGLCIYCFVDITALINSCFVSYQTSVNTNSALNNRQYVRYSSVDSANLTSCYSRRNLNLNGRDVVISVLCGPFINSCMIVKTIVKILCNTLSAVVICLNLV